jgi:hypothetical protein
VEHPIDFVAAANLREKRKKKYTRKATIEVDFISHTRLEFAAESAVTGLARFAVAGVNAIGRAKARMDAHVEKVKREALQLDAGDAPDAAAILPKLALRVEPDRVDEWLNFFGERDAAPVVEPAVAAAQAAMQAEEARKRAERRRLGLSGSDDVDSSAAAKLAGAVKGAAARRATESKRSVLGTLLVIRDAIGVKIKEARAMKANAEAMMAPSALGVNIGEAGEDEDSDTYIGGSDVTDSSDCDETPRGGGERSDGGGGGGSAGGGGANAARTFFVSEATKEEEARAQAAAKALRESTDGKAKAKTRYMAQPNVDSTGRILDTEGFVDRRPRARERAEEAEDAAMSAYARGLVGAFASSTEGGAAPDGAQQTARAANEWSVHCDATGNTFYVNVENGDSSWHLPDDAVVGLSHAHKANNGAAALRAEERAKKRVTRPDGLRSAGGGTGPEVATCRSCLFAVEDTSSVFCANCGYRLVEQLRAEKAGVSGEATGSVAGSVGASAAGSVAAAARTGAAMGSTSEPAKPTHPVQPAGATTEDAERQQARDDPSSTLSVLCRRFPTLSPRDVERIFYDQCLEQAGPAAGMLRKLVASAAAEAAEPEPEAGEGGSRGAACAPGAAVKATAQSATAGARALGAASHASAAATATGARAKATRAGGSGVIPRRTGFNDFAKGVEPSVAVAKAKANAKSPGTLPATDFATAMRPKRGVANFSKAQEAERIASANALERAAAARELRAMRKKAKRAALEAAKTPMSAAMRIATQAKAAAAADSCAPSVDAVASLFDEGPMAIP